MNDQQTTPIGVSKIREYLQHKGSCVGGQPILGSVPAKNYSCACGLDEALAALEAAPIVGEPVGHLVSLEGSDSLKNIFVAMGSDLPDARNTEQGWVAIPIYLAQAPQSSPAPSVIDASDRILEMWHDELMGDGWENSADHDRAKEVWRAAKASRPSVTAPVMSDKEADELRWEVFSAKGQAEEWRKIAFGQQLKEGDAMKTWDKEAFSRVMGIAVEAGVSWTKLPTFYPVIVWRDGIARHANSIDAERDHEMPVDVFEQRLKNTIAFAEHVLSLSTAPQGVTVDQIKGVISEVDDMHPYKVAGNADSYSSYNEGWCDACDIIEDRLSALLTK